MRNEILIEIEQFEINYYLLANESNFLRYDFNLISSFLRCKLIESDYNYNPNMFRLLIS
jgi:hypothetical protein